MNNKAPLATCREGLEIVWAHRPQGKLARPRKNWPRLRLINGTLVAFAEPAPAER